MKVYKAGLKFNLNNLSTAQNSFVFADLALIPLPDATLLTAAENWITAIWLAIRLQMDGGCTLTAGTLDELVNATGEILRHIGTINPACNGSLSGDALPHFSAGSMFARTNVPKVRGSKRIAGLSEVNCQDGLFLNPVLAALAQGATAWLDGPPGFDLPAGVWSSILPGFVPFINQAGVTNVPGTQVTRKIGRGL